MSTGMLKSSAGLSGWSLLSVWAADNMSMFCCQVQGPSKCKNHRGFGGRKEGAVCKIAEWLLQPRNQYCIILQMFYFLQHWYPSPLTARQNCSSEASEASHVQKPSWVISGDAFLKQSQSFVLGFGASLFWGWFRTKYMSFSGEGFCTAKKGMAFALLRSSEKAILCIQWVALSFTFPYLKISPSTRKNSRTKRAQNALICPDLLDWIIREPEENGPRNAGSHGTEVPKKHC